MSAQECPLCGQTMAVWIEQWTRDLDGTTFTWNIPNHKCGCGYYRKIGSDRMMDLRVARAILKYSATEIMNQFAVNTVLDGLGLTKTAIEDIFGLGRIILRRWTNGLQRKNQIYRIVFLFLCESLIQGDMRFYDQLRGMQVPQRMGFKVII